jgi:hypothetical protein
MLGPTFRARLFVMQGEVAGYAGVTVQESEGVAAWLLLSRSMTDSVGAFRTVAVEERQHVDAAAPVHARSSNPGGHTAPQQSRCSRSSWSRLGVRHCRLPSRRPAHDGCRPERRSCKTLRMGTVTALQERQFVRCAVGDKSLVPVSSVPRRSRAWRRGGGVQQPIRLRPSGRVDTLIRAHASHLLKKLKVSTRFASAKSVCKQDRSG